MNGIDLQQLLWPIGSESFLRDYLDQKPLALARQDLSYYGALLTLNDVDMILNQHKLGSALVVTKKGAAPVRVSTDGGWINTNSVYDAFGLGNTIILNAINLHSLAVAQLCSNLQRDLQRSVGCNLYLTPTGAQGFDAHFDNHDVFILQVIGRKRWRIYAAAVQLPLDGANFTMGLSPRQGGHSPQVRARLGDPIHDLEMQPGDLLYIPRGYVHEAWTTDELSMHLTINIGHPRWLDLICEAVRLEAQLRLPLRRALPVGTYTDKALRDSAEQQFRALLRELADSANFEQVLARMKEDFISQITPFPDGHLAQLGKLGTMGLDTVVCHRPGMMCNVFAKQSKAIIQFPGGRMSGPLRLLSALRFIATTPEFAIRELMGGAEDDELLIDQLITPDATICPLSDAGKIILVRRLMQRGLLTFPCHQHK